MSLQVIDAGLSTLVVDLGRPNYRSLGVAVGGAADRVSFILGNALVGNAEDAAALEITAAGPTLRADCDLACVLFGAPFETSNRTAPGATFTLKKDEELRIHGTHRGLRAYLCIRGGVRAPLVLGSRSGLGSLRAGEVLACFAGTIGRRRLPCLEHEPLLEHLHAKPRRLRVLAGAQADWFAVEQFYAQEFHVTPASNRMGLRLQGKPLDLPQRELVSEPVSPGAVQVTRDGQCIILGVDGQTIGGYPKIAHVISADLDALGQLRPHERIKFDPVSLKEAERIRENKQRQLRFWQERCMNSIV